ncbi:MAG: type II toxin-antitoxin system RelE/ParE family toxin [Xanthomonadaceae bacterium]|nr:type II toxin-antitoxin system RelE/ParE family toxin [Xanthomonadaceae bacterium]MDP2185148.1 type II toxin-antitoxin system RelE/ParE family toxin [Xanthomonadales bacterium]MDZ4117580.1 type II toxin-antitoxin system RelE/ParE family toxin [Xanthomonadaceae bacterium]
MEIRHYLDPQGRDVYQAWVDGLKDPIGRKAVVRRVLRIELGNFGDHKFVRDGVSELRIDAGPGYRLYYAQDGDRIVLLLCGGDKGSQQRDIDRAVACWHDYQRRIR